MHDALLQWLWKAHNKVRARLTHDDSVQKGSKSQWPAVTVCSTCYSKAVQEAYAEQVHNTHIRIPAVHS